MIVAILLYRLDLYNIFIETRKTDEVNHLNKSTWCLHCTSYYHTTIYWLRVPSQILLRTHVGFLIEFFPYLSGKDIFFISIKMFVHNIKRFESLNMVWWHAGIQSNSRWKNDGFLKWNIDFWIDFSYSHW